MAKGHYQGGGLLAGEGKISKAKGRRSGLGSDRAAVQARRREMEKKRKTKVEANIKANEKAAKRLHETWEGAASPEDRAKRSSLAAALLGAVRQKGNR